MINKPDIDEGTTNRVWLRWKALYYAVIAIIGFTTVIFADSERRAPLVGPLEQPVVARLELQLGHRYSVNSVAFSPNGRYVLTGGQDHTARLWELRTGRELRRFEGHAGFVDSIAFSHDGRYVLTDGLSAARLWELATGREIQHFDGHRLGIATVAFDPNDRHVLTTDLDGTVRVWDVATGHIEWGFDGHAGFVRAAAFSPDGRYVVIVGSDFIQTEMLS